MTALIAVVLGLAILAVGVWMIRLLAMPTPPDPDPDDVVEIDVDYRCTVCGLRLTVTHARDSDVKAPKHCREEMEAVRG